ncbi:MAG: hypothetical protein D6788_04625, partial [Planctomycetota bacterium]
MRALRGRSAFVTDGACRAKARHFLFARSNLCLYRFGRRSLLRFAGVVPLRESERFLTGLRAGTPARALHADRHGQAVGVLFAGVIGWGARGGR